MEMFSLSNAFLSSALISVLVALLLRLYDVMVARPRRLHRALTKQGLTGPPPSFLVGNLLEIRKLARDAAAVTGLPRLSHNCTSTLLPFFAKWKGIYGDLYVFSMGRRQFVVVTEEKMVREMTTCTSLDLGKPLYQAEDMGPLLGQGITTSNGPYWAHQRKVIAPEFYMDKVKGMTNLVQDSTAALLKSWTSRIENEGTGWADIEICSDLRSFSGDVISKACFGSNYSEGQLIFSKLGALQEALSKKLFKAPIPWIRNLPTKSNREIWALEREIKILILDLIKERKQGRFQEDLLQSLLDGSKNIDMGQDAINRFIVDNCKNIYLGGFETTAISVAWCLMLLAAHPVWQDRIRAEALEICKGQIPDAQMVRKMKLLTMAINESLRLYPPVTVFSREALKDMKLKNINIPKAVILWSSVTMLHTDPEIWGMDSYQFNPERFANGVTGACKFPHMFMPFGIGPRVCVGQNLALLELKILISSILSTFSLSLSPKYVHSPALKLVLEPLHGVHLLVKKL